MKCLWDRDSQLQQTPLQQQNSPSYWGAEEWLGGQCQNLLCCHSPLVLPNSAFLALGRCVQSSRV